MTTNFIALYRGATVAEAQLVAVSAEPEIVSQFMRALAGETEATEEQKEAESCKPLRLVGRGQK